MLWTLALSALVICSISADLPLWTAAAAAVVMALASPSLDAVIRTIWRTIATTEAEVKALHSYDSILEEAGFLVGPLLASILMLGFGPRSGLYVVAAGVIAGGVLALLPAEIRAALRQQPVRAEAAAAAPVTGRAARIRRALRTAAGPIATPQLQRIVAPLILMGVQLGILGNLGPSAERRQRPRRHRRLRHGWRVVELSRSRSKACRRRPGPCRRTHPHTNYFRKPG